MASRPDDSHTRSSALDLAGAVRVIGATVKAMGFDAPGFRSPPRLVGVDRSIRRRRSPSGSGISAVVSVRVKGRPWAAVLADMIEGVVVANELTPPDADRVRTELWSVLQPSIVPMAAPRRVA
jgi:hypothetical protein